jgi:hypothetical protein
MHQAVRRVLADDERNIERSRTRGFGKTFSERLRKVRGSIGSFSNCSTPSPLAEEMQQQQRRRTTLASASGCIGQLRLLPTAIHLRLPEYPIMQARRIRLMLARNISCDTRAWHPRNTKKSSTEREVN